MNKDRIRALADRIELEGRFDYAMFFGGDGVGVEQLDYAPLSQCAEALAYRCGTVGCIAGWALTLAWLAGEDVDALGVSPQGHRDEVCVMARWLEIDYEIADYLAYGGLFPEWDEENRHPMTATATEVSKALREWADGDREIAVGPRGDW